MKIQIAPSILSADFGNLNEEMKSVESYADLFHVDVMDGHFVPNLTIGAPVVKCLKSALPLSCHLMIENPENFVEQFAKAGAATITIHVEAAKDLKTIISQIKSYGVRAGVSIKPKTEVSAIESVINDVDEVLVMSVEPGFGGQEFMENSLEKIAALRKMRPDLDIAVDGGINDKTAKRVIEAGANILVSGSYIFGAPDRAAAIKSLTI